LEDAKNAKIKGVKEDTANYSNDKLTTAA